MDEEVKAKNEKRPTRAYTRVRWGGFSVSEGGVFFEISFEGFFKRVTSNNRFDLFLLEAV